MQEASVTQIRAVFFDVGEVIVNETREYGTWADWLGVPRHTFSAVFGAVIARGQDYRETFQHFRPGFDLAVERQRRADAGHPESFTEEDIYPDVRPCLRDLRAQGLRTGLAGNQTSRAEGILKSLDFGIDVIGTSDGWGVEKPSLGFFERVVEEARCDASSVLYIGDRIDNDVRPAQQVGMQTVLLRRGPWGYILDDKEVVDRCLSVVEDLTTLSELVREHNERHV
jgi:HAD superfamily hydrolase (TIGR01662 family)